MREDFLGESAQEEHSRSLKLFGFILTENEKTELFLVKNYKYFFNEEKEKFGSSFL